jgi:hypothetical protein
VTFADDRKVDGELLPFRTVRQEALGEITTTITRTRFNVRLPKGAFAPRR